MDELAPNNLFERLESIVEEMDEDCKAADTKSKRLLAEFSSFRRRSEIEKEEALALGADKAVAVLSELIDDCDRALAALPAETPALVTDGIAHLRKTALDRFVELGYQPVAEIGEIFNPRFHEALSLESGPGQEGEIVRIFRLGWRRQGGPVVRPALVAVCRGEYICPFGIAYCTGDCAGCAVEEE